MTVTVLQGEDQDIIVTLKQYNSSNVAVVVDVSSPTSITASLTLDNSETAALTWAVASGHASEDYANGVIVVVLTAAQTTALAQGLYRLSVEVIKGGDVSKWTMKTAVKLIASFVSVDNV